MSGTQQTETAADVFGTATGITSEQGINHPDISGMTDEQIKSQVELMVSVLNQMWANDKEIFMQKFIDNILLSIKDNTRDAINQFVKEAIDENVKALDPEMKAQLLKEMVDKALGNLSPDKVQKILQSESATKVPTDNEKEKATAPAAASGDEKLETNDETNAKTTAAAPASAAEVSDDDKAKAASSAEVSDDTTKSSDLTQTLTDPKAAAAALQGQGEEMVGDALQKAQEEAEKKTAEMAEEAKKKALGLLPGPFGAIAGTLVKSGGGARSTRRRKSKKTKRRRQTQHKLTNRNKIRQTMKR